MLTHQQKIANLVREKVAKVTTNSRGWTRSRLDVVLKDCGWSRRSSTNLRQIQDAFEKARIYPEPILTAPGLEWEEVIYFSRAKPKPYDNEWYATHPTFASERNLQGFLARNIDRLAGFKNLKKPQVEYSLPSGRRIDILCREKKTNNLVAIEIKKGGSDAIGQLERYLVELDRKVASKETPKPAVKGIIVTGQPNSAAERSLAERIQDFPVQWFVYRVQLKMHLRASTGA